MFLLASNFVGFSPVPLFSVGARDHVGTGPGLTGLLVLAQGIGSLITGTAIAMLGTGRHQGCAFISACVIWMLSLLGFCLAISYPVSFVMILLFGMAIGIHQSTHLSIVLVSCEPSMRGRAMGVSALCIGVVPFGILTIGAVAEAMSAPTAIWINAVI